VGDQSGREVCTIAVDESGARRRTVRLAFELYSLGEYSLERLAKALTARLRPASHAPSSKSSAGSAPHTSKS
jgi:hypothetical protein